MATRILLRNVFTKQRITSIDKVLVFIGLVCLISPIFPSYVFADEPKFKEVISLPEQKPRKIAEILSPGISSMDPRGALRPADKPVDMTPLAPAIDTSSSLLTNKTSSLKPLRLSIALNESLMNNPRTAAIRAELGIVKTQYYAATAMPNPVLYRDEGAIAEQVRRFGATNIYEPPWKMALRMLAAKQQFKETKLEVLKTLWDFRNDIRRSYTEVVTSQENYQTLSDLADLSNQLLVVTQKRLAAGAVPALDELKARLALSQVEIERKRGLMKIQKSKQKLNIILARKVDNLMEIPRLPLFKLKAAKSDMLPDFSKPVPPLSSFIEQAMENRLELRIAKQQIKVNQALLYNAYGNILPNPSFATGDSVNGNAPSGPKLRGFFVTVNVELPAFQFSQGEIPKYKATIKRFELEYLAAKNQVTEDVTSAYNDLIIARERIRQYEDHTLAESEEVARLAQRSYEVGQSDIASTLLALQANVLTRSQFLDAVTDYAQAITNLEQSIGEPIQ